MKDKFEEIFLKNVEDLNMDLPEILRFIFKDLLYFEADDFYDSSAKYSKKYFADYYSVNIKTFNNWIKLFCPKIFENNYKNKRKFSRIEFYQIIESLGQSDKRKMKPFTKKEMCEVLYKNNKWKKSKEYEQLEQELEKFIPSSELKMNTIPPRVANEVFLEYLDSEDGFVDLRETISKSQTNFTTELKQKKFLELIKEKKAMSFQERIHEKNKTYKFIKEIFEDIPEEE